MLRIARTAASEYSFVEFTGGEGLWRTYCGGSIVTMIRTAGEWHRYNPVFPAEHSSHTMRRP
jgi:hypothetical protein